MAGPHVVGALALLWSAAPSLVGDVGAAERVITGTARPRTSSQGCGGDGPDDVPNHVYGWGIVDALAAVRKYVIELEVTKQAHPDPAWAGARLTYTISITNTGGVTLTTTVTDSLPGQVTPTGVLTWALDPLPPGESWTKTVTVTMGADYAGPLTNVVEATAPEGASDAYTLTTASLRPRPEVSKRAVVPAGLLVSSLDYTLSVTNASPLTLTEVVLTDILPVSTTLASASGAYAQADGVVTWTVDSLAPGEVLTATLMITGEGISPGASVVNAEYGVLARELPDPVTGASVEVTIPWRCLLFPIFKDWSMEGDDDA